MFLAFWPCDVVKRVKSSGETIVVMQRSEPAAVLVNPDYYEILEEALENLEDLRDIELRKSEPTISMDEYMKKRFGKNPAK